MRYYVLLACLFIVGCAHCSRTQTQFSGKTSGINPYGTGDIVISRDSIWGNSSKCLEKMLNAVPVR